MTYTAFSMFNPSNTTSYIESIKGDSDGKPVRPESFLIFAEQVQCLGYEYAVRIGRGRSGDDENSCENYMNGKLSSWTTWNDVDLTNLRDKPKDSFNCKSVGLEAAEPTTLPAVAPT